MRYRSKTGKLKWGKHSSSIPGLEQALHHLDGFSEIEAIFPGPFTRLGGHSIFSLKVQYETKDGLKCLAVCPSGTQEVYITTTNKSAVITKINKLYPRQIKHKRKIKPVKAKPEPPITQCGIKAFGKCRICILCNRCATHQKTLQPCNVCLRKS